MEAWRLLSAALKGYGVYRAVKPPSREEMQEILQGIQRCRDQDMAMLWLLVMRGELNPGDEIGLANVRREHKRRIKKDTEYRKQYIQLLYGE